MATLKELKNKIGSLKNTQKITRAMKMIAATKLRKAQMAAENSRDYAKSLEAVMREAISSANVEHPLCIARDQVKTVGLLLFTSDRGLCGGFNSNAIKKGLAEIAAIEAEGKAVVTWSAGKRANDALKKKGYTIKGFYEEAMANPSFEQANAMAEDMIAAFESGEIDEIKVVYNEFVSAITQTPTAKLVVPAVIEQNDDNQSAGGGGNTIFEPSASNILSNVVIRSVKFQVFQALLNSVAGEHAARMTAMENATNNSKDMIDKYTLQHNRARQAQITTELTEIVSGAEALKG